MGSGDDVTEIEQWLLGHGEVYKLRLEPIDLHSKTNLVEWIKRELWKWARDDTEVVSSWPPRIVGLQQNSVTVMVIDFLEVCNEAIDVTTGARPSNSAVDDN